MLIKQGRLLCVADIEFDVIGPVYWKKVSTHGSIFRKVKVKHSTILSQFGVVAHMPTLGVSTCYINGSIPPIQASAGFQKSCYLIKLNAEKITMDIKALDKALQ